MKSEANGRFLPVYDVIRAGVTDSQVKSLAASLKIPAGKLVVTHGAVSFVDSANYMAIPHVPVRDSAVIQGLLASTKNEHPDVTVRCDAIDIGALSRLSVLEAAVALKLTADAFEGAGLPLAMARPDVRHAHGSVLGGHPGREQGQADRDSSRAGPRR